MLNIDDLKDYQQDNQLAYRSQVSLHSHFRPYDGSVRFSVTNKRRGSISHFGTLAEAVDAFNIARTGA